jgi:2-isopropylmalate synthase
MLKPAWAERFEIGVSPEKLAKLTAVSAGSTKCSTARPAPQAPYVGASAFATKAGIHASALLKDPRPMSMSSPKRSAMSARVMVSDQGGKSNFINELNRRGIDG